MIKSDFRSNISKVEIFAKNAIFRPASPLKGLRDHFHLSALTSGENPHAASHVRDVKVVNGVDVRAKCGSQQGKLLYKVILHVSKTYRYITAEVTELPPL